MSLIQKKDRVLAPFVKLLPRWLTPNQLTIARIVLALPLLWFLILNDYFSASIVMIIAAVLDMSDGTLARLRKKTSTTGAILDPIADKVLLGVFLVTAGLSNVPTRLLVVVIVMEIITVLGTLIYPIFMRNIYDVTTRIQANIFGQYKIFFYTFAVLLVLVAEHHRWIVFFADISFGLGTIASLASMLYYIRTLRTGT